MFSVNFGSLTTGISLFWASPMLVKLRNGTDTPLSRPITEEEGSWIVSGGYLAAVASRIDEAIDVLSKVRESDEIIKQELEDYRSSKQIKVNKIELIRDRTFLKSLSLGVLVCAGANMIGYSAISFYLQTIFESTNTSVAPEIASLVIGFIQLFAALCTTFFTKFFGRRTILIYSLLGMFVGMFGLGIFFTFSTKEGYVITGFLNYLPIISMILCTYNFNVGIGCLLLVVTAELFDGTARAFGYSICLTSSLFLAFLTSKYFVEFTLALGPPATYWFFSAMCLVVCTLIAVFLPETKGKTFNEIQVSLGRQRLENEPGPSQRPEC
ncbi:unnamed protein product [Danaus chrysippus]|uniref:(African queen) hypothetical protein n=1 Tax=Danaus chrysippus TaxID=151541 RepID=A0A8J2QT85_9NEOP|nr:unnamed protein product [Danaus chrysippus]